MSINSIKNIAGYIEFDLPPVIERKRKVLQSSPLHHYHSFAVNLDTQAGLDEMMATMHRIICQTTKKIVVLAECIFMYLKVESVGGILKRLSAEFPKKVALIGFEPICGKDAFGRVMLENLHSRRLPLEWIKSFPGITELEAFFRDCNFDCINLIPMNEAEGKLGDADRKALQTKCILDEYEEWQLFCRHYVFFDCES